jgi:hypothetical protein
MGRSPISPTSVPVLRQAQDERGDRVKPWLISCLLGNSSIFCAPVFRPGIILKKQKRLGDELTHRPISFVLLAVELMLLVLLLL